MQPTPSHSGAVTELLSLQNLHDVLGDILFLLKQTSTHD